ncbi:MAG: aminotransferase class III-fold pyridoxal phosphate-dependent enzyme [Thermodesulfovibrionales bacterium]|nr:aminotransferase class III-fold pyridoxal phosphate-dependent enzyme [Thermodesulfovibrionales bacterium]
MGNKVTFNEGYPSIKESDALYARALGLIPAVTQTLAKGPSQYVKGVAPKYLSHGKGCRVWDVDGNEYIDYTMGVGPVSLGYCYEKVDNAIIEQLKKGITFSLMHPLEVEVAEMIRDIIPNADSVRFSKTGADVTSAAVRLARAYTGRQKVLCCGYHGWHDWYIGITTKNLGVPECTKELTYTFDYNDVDSLIDAIDVDTACVIIEPITFQQPQNGFLHEVRDICNRTGCILIFDEMWTGFRVAIGGAQERFKVDADLMCFSKAVANGMPLSILAGRKEIMELLEEDVFFFTTFGGETLSLAAAKATITEIVENRVTDYLEEKGSYLRDRYNTIVEELNIPFTNCVGLGCRTMVSFDGSYANPLYLKSLMQQLLIKKGILWSGFHNISYSHTQEDIEYTISAYKEVLAELKEAVEKDTVFESLLGSPVQPVFRKTSGFNFKPIVRSN